MCTVAIDYDGTINSDFVAARKAIKKLKEEGHIIVIWSSRNNPRQHNNRDEMMSEMIGNLKKYKIPYDEVDVGDIGKFHAQVYIDDKALEFKNNWDEIVDRIY